MLTLIIGEVLYPEEIKWWLMLRSILIWVVNFVSLDLHHFITWENKFELIWKRYIDLLSKPKTERPYLKAPRILYRQRFGVEDTCREDRFMRIFYSVVKISDTFTTIGTSSSGYTALRRRSGGFPNFLCSAGHLSCLIFFYWYWYGRHSR